MMRFHIFFYSAAFLCAGLSLLLPWFSETDGTNFFITQSTAGVFIPVLEMALCPFLVWWQYNKNFAESMLRFQVILHTGFSLVIMGGVVFFLAKLESLAVLLSSSTSSQVQPAAGFWLQVTFGIMLIAANLAYLTLLAQALREDTAKKIRHIQEKSPLLV